MSAYLTLAGLVGALASSVVVFRSPGLLFLGLITLSLSATAVVVGLIQADDDDEVSQ